MSWRIQGTIVPFKKSAALTTGTREVGKLIHINNAGEATFTKDDIYFPLTEKFIADEESVSSAQVTGVAKVFVETAASIVAGSPVKAGTVGTGIALAVAGDNILGYALETPAGDGDYIPVLLQKGQVNPA